MLNIPGNLVNYRTILFVFLYFNEPFWILQVRGAGNIVGGAVSSVANAASSVTSSVTGRRRAEAGEIFVDEKTSLSVKVPSFSTQYNSQGGTGSNKHNVM